MEGFSPRERFCAQILHGKLVYKSTPEGKINTPPGAPGGLLEGLDRQNPGGNPRKYAKIGSKNALFWVFSSIIRLQNATFGEVKTPLFDPDLANPEGSGQLLQPLAAPKTSHFRLSIHGAPPPSTSPKRPVPRQNPIIYSSDPPKPAKTVISRLGPPSGTRPRAYGQPVLEPPAAWAGWLPGPPAAIQPDSRQFL